MLRNINKIKNLDSVRELDFDIALDTPLYLYLFLVAGKWT
jgi:hypothetical protein